MITVIVIALALCAVMLFYMAVRSRRTQAEHSFRAVDLNALRTLMDRDDELFLRAKLPRSKFSHLKAPANPRDYETCYPDCRQRFRGDARG